MSRQRSFRQHYSRAGLVKASIQGLLSGQDECVSVEQLLNILKIAHGDRVRLRHKLVRVFCRILGREASPTSAATADMTKNTSVSDSATDDCWLRTLAPLLAGYMGVPLPRANKSAGAEPAPTLSLEGMATQTENMINEQFGTTLRDQRQAQSSIADDTATRRTSYIDHFGSLNFFPHLLPVECAYLDPTMMQLPSSMSVTQPGNVSTHMQSNCCIKADFPTTFEQWGVSAEVAQPEVSAMPHVLVPLWSSVLTQLLDNARCLLTKASSKAPGATASLDRAPEQQVLDELTRSLSDIKQSIQPGKLRQQSPQQPRNFSAQSVHAAVIQLLRRLETHWATQAPGLASMLRELHAGFERDASWMPLYSHHLSTQSATIAPKSQQPKPQTKHNLSQPIRKSTSAHPHGKVPNPGMKSSNSDRAEFLLRERKLKNAKRSFVMELKRKKGFSLAGDNQLSDPDRRTIVNFVCHCNLKFKLVAPAGAPTKFRLHSDVLNLPNGGRVKRVVWIELDYTNMSFKVNAKKTPMALSREEQIARGIATVLKKYPKGFSLAGDNMLSDADRRTIANFICHCDLKFKLAAPTGATTKFRLHRDMSDLPNGGKVKRVVWIELDYSNMSFKVTAKKKTVAPSRKAQIAQATAAVLKKHPNGFSNEGDNALSESDRQRIAVFIAHCELKFKLPGSEVIKIRLHRSISKDQDFKVQRTISMTLDHDNMMFKMVVNSKKKSRKRNREW